MSTAPATDPPTEMVDGLYRALMRAGHRPHEIDEYEIRHIGLMVDTPDDGALHGADLAAANDIARRRGERLAPTLDPTTHGRHGADIAAALAARRARG